MQQCTALGLRATVSEQPHLFAAFSAILDMAARLPPDDGLTLVAISSLSALAYVQLKL